MREDPLGPTEAHLAAAGVVIGPYTATSKWDGHPFDVVWAIDVLRGPQRFMAARVGSSSGA
jgi:hypothetical protein